MNKEKKTPLMCRIFDHNWQRKKELDQGPLKQACKCMRCGKIIYVKG